MALNKLRTLFILLILDSLSATRALMVSTFLSEMERILQEQPDMQVSTPILVMNNQEEMTWKVLDMSSYISLKDHSHGKVSQEDLRLRSMQTLKRRKRT